MANMAKQSTTPGGYYEIVNDLRISLPLSISDTLTARVVPRLRAVPMILGSINMIKYLQAIQVFLCVNFQQIFFTCFNWCNEIFIL
jgi:hypothetical protein